MKPREKAETLVYYYENLLEPYIVGVDTLFVAAIKCALIAVDEILDLYSFKNGTVTFIIQNENYDFWQEVKKELEAMK